MSLESPRGSVRSEINVTPLVDVCLVLLIIFMVVAPILHAGVKVDLPKTTQVFPLSQDPKQLTISVAQDGGVYVRSVRVASSDLPALLAEIHTAEPDRDVIVRGDRALQYETVCEVLAAVSHAGFTHVGLVTETEKAPPVAR
ncbi:MAG TPA: ExbD/TolR family protein [Thermoanaerobaculia bacterium]|nr:ExbD/TolR family protein [Thermoanaerobaculia bacterium]